MPEDSTFIPGIDLEVTDPTPDISWGSQAVKLVPGKSDKELAEEIKRKTEAAIEPMLEIFTEAKSQGFDVSYLIQMDGRGRAYLHSLKIMKEY